MRPSLAETLRPEGRAWGMPAAAAKVLERDIEQERVRPIGCLVQGDQARFRGRRRFACGAQAWDIA